MDDISQIAVLKRWLLDDVAMLAHQNGRAWKQPIADTVNELRKQQWPAVYFGGTLRSLIVGRLMGGSVGRPRDIDIVVGDSTVEELEGEFNAHLVRKTRFGGLHLKRCEWDFDIWPIQETYAFRAGHPGPVDFSELPRTTFFNLEAIAVDVWAPPGDKRKIYTADDSFFTGLLRREIEINNENNPFPELCVVRSLVLAASLNWNMGPKLLHYLAEVSPEIPMAELENVQLKHYGRVEIPSYQLSVALDSIRRAFLQQPNQSFAPFPQRQRIFWPEEESFLPRIRFRTLKMKKATPRIFIGGVN